MNTFARVSRLFRRRGGPRFVEHAEWPEQTGGRRVLVENPDRAELLARADCLREAGYDVATCAGPAVKPEPVAWFRRSYWADAEPRDHHEATVCPLLAEGYCSLVEGADVVVSTTRLVDGRGIHAALATAKSPKLVVEATTPELERDGLPGANAVAVAEPVMPQQLVAAVDRALIGGPSGSKAAS